jgi:hypothetical protein
MAPTTALSLIEKGCAFCKQPLDVTTAIICTASARFKVAGAGNEHLNWSEPAVVAVCHDCYEKHGPKI